MSDIRELLELAAKAAGYNVDFADWRDCGGWTDYRKIPGGYWNPSINDGDCARMCAALEIGTQWVGSWVECSHGEVFRTEEFYNDRLAAWRMAALRVAAEIGRQRDELSGSNFKSSECWT